jgi:hypothetical protein
MSARISNVQRPFPLLKSIDLLKIARRSPLSGDFIIRHCRASLIDQRPICDYRHRWQQSAPFATFWRATDSAHLVLVRPQLRTSVYWQLEATSISKIGLRYHFWNESNETPGRFFDAAFIPRAGQKEINDPRAVKCGALMWSRSYAQVFGENRPAAISIECRDPFDVSDACGKFLAQSDDHMVLSE